MLSRSDKHLIAVHCKDELCSKNAKGEMFLPEFGAGFSTVVAGADTRDRRDVIREKGDVCVPGHRQDTRCLCHLSGCSTRWGAVLCDQSLYFKAPGQG